MKNVRPKKHLGQHFLIDEAIAKKIGETLIHSRKYKGILEVGPGMGVMTKYTSSKYPDHDLRLIELDKESVVYLGLHFPLIKVYNVDFLKLDFSDVFDHEFAVIGNYPYNISSQIVFKVIENRHLIPEMSGMFQKEVAERICSKHGSKVYGILSVLVQFYYEANYLFTVDENVFNPPPKVKSGVLSLNRLDNSLIEGVPYSFAKAVVKSAFNQRRKTLRNSLKSFIKNKDQEWLNLRPEQLSIEDFAEKVKYLYGQVND